MNCSQIFCTFAVETTTKPNVRLFHVLWIALKFFVLLQSKQHSWWSTYCERCCELLSNFLYFCSRNNSIDFTSISGKLWIALKFFVLLQSKQRRDFNRWHSTGCELLSNFLYFCSRNNSFHFGNIVLIVVNCSQIFCTFAVETTSNLFTKSVPLLWIALKFFVLLQSKQPCACLICSAVVVNCSQIFCTFAVETTVNLF